MLFGAVALKISSVIKSPAIKVKNRNSSIAKYVMYWNSWWCLEKWRFWCYHKTIAFVGKRLKRRINVSNLIVYFFFKWLKWIFFSWNSTIKWHDLNRQNEKRLKQIWFTCDTGVKEADDWTRNQSSNRYWSDDTLFFRAHGPEIADHHAKRTQIGKTTNGECCNCRTSKLKEMRFWDIFNWIDALSLYKLTEMAFVFFSTPNFSYATNSLMIFLVAITAPTFSQSSHCMPMI